MSPCIKDWKSFSSWCAINFRFYFILLLPYFTVGNVAGTERLGLTDKLFWSGCLQLWQDRLRGWDWRQTSRLKLWRLWLVQAMQVSFCSFPSVIFPYVILHRRWLADGDGCKRNAKQMGDASQGAATQLQLIMDASMLERSDAWCWPWSASLKA